MAAEDTPRPPLWGDLEQAMRAELYPGNARGAPSNPLRLAEEYRTYLGPTALNDLVRAQIRDEAWRPGPLHDCLLRLPWADVLTTNWDTLIERGARKVASPYYSVVRSCADVGHARAPRIIKLHGTIGASEHFIFAEEDYRTYPTHYAPFVNLARQVFIENELVLLGFSGDDPNFLQWSGWVRDQLGGAARRIYLVGVLDLGPAKRKLLEAMNVAPIDLAPLVSAEPDNASRHARGTSLFLEFLASAAPTPKHDWRLAAREGANRNTQEEWDRQHEDDAYAASLLDRAATDWESDRKSYPGWLVCPAEKRIELRHRTDDAPFLTTTRLALIDPERRLNLLYELAWRHKTAFWPVPRYLYDLFGAAVQSAQSSAPQRRERLEITALLLRTARLAYDESGFESWTSVLEAHAAPESDLRAEAAYQRALRARDCLDFGSILSYAAAIRTGRDPAWRLRLAALHSQCGEFDEAIRLLTEVVTELHERQVEDRSSIWLRSRRAWAQWLERAARRGQLLTTGQKEEWPSEFADIRSDPWDEINGIRDEVAQALRKRREEQVKFLPLYLPGHYRDTSATVTFVSSTEVTPAETLESLAETVGVPERIGCSSLLGATAKDVMELASDDERAGISWHCRWLRVVFDHSDLSIERHLGRVRIAQMESQVAQGLIDAVTKSVGFWRERVRRIRLTDDRYDTFAVERLRFFVEIRSRLTARQSAAGARDSFALAMDLGADASLRHMWLREQIGHLADYAVRAMLPADRAEVVLDALLFPLPNEWGPEYAGYVSPTNWLNGIRPNRPDNDARWKSRIARLIDETRCEAGRAEASLRLIYLSENSALTDDERRSFSHALWSQLDGVDSPLPIGTGLLPHVFTLLPAPDGIDVQEAVRRRLFGPTSGGSGDPLSAITAAATSSRPLRPLREQAIHIFDRIAKWRPEAASDAISEAFTRAETARLKRAIGPALAKAIVPALDPSDLTAERGRSLLSLIEEKGVVTALWVLPFFIRDSDDEDSLAFIRRIRRGLFSRHSDEIFGATQAVITWAERGKQNSRGWLPATLVEQILTSLETPPGPGLDFMLQTARRLVEERVVLPQDFYRLTTALETLLASASYEGLSSDEEASVTISLVRAECVRLAAALQASGATAPAITAWLDAGRTDPLPEVRFALQPS